MSRSTLGALTHMTCNHVEQNLMLAILLRCRMLLTSLRTLATRAAQLRAPFPAARPFNGVLPAVSRLDFSTTAVFRNDTAGNAAEARMIDILRTRFPEATDLAVVDISGGCGSMYEVFVEAPDFAGQRMVKCHKMVTDALKAEIKEMHGLRISTAASPKPCGGGSS